MIAFANQIETTTNVSSGDVTTYTYDAAGNRTLREVEGAGSTTYTWDGDGRLNEVHLPTGLRVTYTYNADGLLTNRNDGAQTEFIWDGQNLLSIRGPADPLVFTYKPGELYGMLLSSHQGSFSRTQPRR
jgi:YD repeat-containing protein